MVTRRGGDGGYHCDAEFFEGRGEQPGAVERSAEPPSEALIVTLLLMDTVSFSDARGFRPSSCIKSFKF